MKLQDEINKVLADTGSRLAQDPDFCKLQEFYREKIQEGVALKQDYNLPPLDTIGRGIYAYFGADSAGSGRRKS